MHYWLWKADKDQFNLFLVRLQVPSVCVQPADSIPVRLNTQIPSVEARQKLI